MRVPSRDRAGNAVGRWVRVVSAHPTGTLLAIALLVALAALAATRLGIDTDSSRMLSNELPFRQRSVALERAFPEVQHSIVIAVRSEVPDAADAVVSVLSQTLRDREDAFEWVHAPTADPFLVSHGLLYLGLDELDTRLARLGQAADLLAALRSDRSLENFLQSIAAATTLAGQAGVEIAPLEPLYAETAAVLAAQRRGLDRPFGWTGALGGGEDGPTVRLINLGPRLDFSALQPAGAALDAVDQAIAGLEPDLAGAVEIGVTGDPALRAEELASVTERLLLSMILSVLLVAVLLRFALGSVARTVLALGALTVTLVLTAGFAGLTVGTLNLVSVAFVVLMVGLGIDYAIHLISHFDEHRIEVSGGRRDALVETGRTLGPALLLSAATTSLAFFAFATTDFIGMAQLGLIGGAGVLIALAVALTVIPAAVTLWPRLDSGPLPGPLPLPSRRATRAFRGVAVAAGLAGFALAPFARFEADPMALRDPEAPSVRAYAWLADLPTLTPMRLSLIVEDAEAARAAVAALEPLPEVRAVNWLGDLVPEDQDAKLELIDLAYPSIMHAVGGQPARLGQTGEQVTPEGLAEVLADQPGAAAAELAAELAAYAERRTPSRDGALAADLFLYFPMLIDTLARQVEANAVTVESLPEALRERYVADDGRLRVEIVPAVDAETRAGRAAFVNAVHAVAPGAAGPPDVIHGAAGTIGVAMLQAAGLALAGCLLLAWLMLREAVRVGAILVPVLMTAAVTVGVSVLFGLPFNYANVIVLPLLIGIGIDSGVHVALRASGAPGSVFDTSTPRAVLFSAMTTIAAFGTLALSTHPGTASMGILLATAVAAAVTMTFALTPPLIRLARRRSGP